MRDNRGTYLEDCNLEESRTSRVVLALVTAATLLLVLSMLAGCTWASGSSTSQSTTTSTARVTTSLALATTPTTAAAPSWAFPAADLTLAEKVYVRQIGLRIYMLIDHAWTLEDTALEQLLKGNVQAVDGTRLENAAALALFTYVETDSAAAPTSRLESMRSAFAGVMYPYSEALIELDTAVSAQDSSQAPSWAAKPRCAPVRAAAAGMRHN